MDELNYHHLYYFWVVTQEGGVTRASRKLNVAQPTISAQLKRFEDSLGTPLFERRGRSLVLTAIGRKVQRYAEQIFTLGKELLGELNGREPSIPTRFAVGITHDLPATVAEPLLAPLWNLPQPVPLVLHTGTPGELLAAQAMHDLDIVLATEPSAAHATVRTHSRLLADLPVELVGPPELATRYRRGFPGSLQNAPLILPATANRLRIAVERWLAEHRLKLQVVAEVDDEAWQRRLCAQGRGLIATVRPRADSLQSVGKLSGVTVPCYAITLERQPTHPAIRTLFSQTEAQG
jgi:LysR family transcriptional activator of nhaA